MPGGSATEAKINFGPFLGRGMRARVILKSVAKEISYFTVSEYKVVRGKGSFSH